MRLIVDHMAMFYNSMWLIITSFRILLCMAEHLWKIDGEKKNRNSSQSNSARGKYQLYGVVELGYVINTIKNKRYFKKYDFVSDEKEVYMLSSSKFDNFY